MIESIHHINIQPDLVRIDGKEFVINDSETKGLKSIYKTLDLKYPKFYKMDGLSKLGFLAVELLKTKLILEADFENDLGLLFYNDVSCKESDLKYWNNVKKGKANPSLFVYTLPNIVLGEICIHNKWYGESMFCIETDTSPNRMQEVMETWFELNKVKYCILCNLDYTDDSRYFANLQFLLKNKEK